MYNSIFVKWSVDKSRKPAHAEFLELLGDWTETETRAENLDSIAVPLFMNQKQEPKELWLWDELACLGKPSEKVVW